MALGWTTWLDYYEVRRHVANCRTTAVRHVHRADAIRAYKQWHAVWAATRRERLARAEAEIARQVAMEAELSRVKTELAAALDERLKLRERVAKLDGDHAAAEAAYAELQAAERGERRAPSPPPPS